MKYIHQFCIILLISMAGEFLHRILPLPVPTGIYGLLLMLVMLLTGFLKLEQVEQTGAFLLEIMPLMFIPSAAGLLDSWTQLQTILLPFAIIILPVTWIVLGVSGRVTQAIIRRKERRHE